MILAAHQPNFVPWFPFFDKMNKADVFVVLINVQYEKNGWQNRCHSHGRYLTMPVQRGKALIKEKKYTNGEGMVDVNMHWILAIAKTLGIDTSKIHFDHEMHDKATARLVQLCHRFKCDEYLTNPEATEKYLDEGLMESAGIGLLDHDCSHRKHIFEMFAEYGIEGTRKIMNKEKHAFDKASL